jgi:hypothetical protein
MDTHKLTEWMSIASTTKTLLVQSFLGWLLRMWVFSSCGWPNLLLQNLQAWLFLFICLRWLLAENLVVSTYSMESLPLSPISSSPSFFLFILSNDTSTQNPPHKPLIKNHHTTRKRDLSDNNNIQFRAV